MTNSIEITIETIFTHEYFMCFYGVLIWYLLLMIIEKKTNKGKFSFKAQWKRNSLDVVVTLAIAPLIVIFDDEFIDIYNSTFENDIEIGKMVYFGAGPAFNLLVRLVTGFIKKE